MKHRSVIYYVVAPLSVLFSTAFAMALQPIIDYGLERQMERFAGAVAAAVVFCLLDILFGFLTEYSLVAARTDKIKLLRNRCMDQIMQSRYEAYSKNDNAYYVSLLTVNMEQIGQKYYESGMKIYRYVFSLVISVIAMGYAGWEIMLYVVIFSGISVYLPKLFQTQSILAEKAYAKESQEHIALLQETFGNFIPIRVFRLWSQRRKRHEAKCEELAETDRQRSRKAFMLNSVAAGIGELSYVLIIIFAMILVIRGKLTVGYIMSVSQILGGIMFPFEVLPGCILERKSGKVLKAALEQECRAASDSRPVIKQLERKPLFLKCNDVSFGYDEGTVLHHISFRFELSGKYAVIGKSGSGKSTLAKGICGLLTPVCGCCTLDDTDVLDICDSELFHYLMYQDQNTGLFDATIRDNIDLNGTIREDRMQQIIQAAGLYDVTADGTKLLQRRNFSGGEIQRILLARALASGARMLVLDECFSALDNANAKRIEADLLSQKEMGVIMITHRIFEENMRSYDCVLLIEDGRLVEAGRWDKLQHKAQFLPAGSPDSWNMSLNS